MALAERFSPMPEGEIDKATEEERTSNQIVWLVENDDASEKMFDLAHKALDSENEATKFSTGQDVLDAFKKAYAEGVGPDVVFLDFDLDNDGSEEYISGLDVLREIKNIAGEGSQPRIVAYTATPENLKEMTDLGAENYGEKYQVISKLRNILEIDKE